MPNKHTLPKEATTVVVSERARVSRPRGRPRINLNLVVTDKMRAAGQSWGAISRGLGVHRNTLLAHRQGGYSERFVPIPQKRLLRVAARFLRADMGEGLTQIELKDAQMLVRLLRFLSIENEKLREALSRARQQIRDYERLMAR